MRILPALFLTLVLAGCRAAPVQLASTAEAPAPSEATVPVEFFPLPTGRTVFYGLLAHSNGKVYVGINYGIARLAEFDPASGKWRIVARMTSRASDAGGETVDDPTLHGDFASGPYPDAHWKFAQDKIHTQLHEGADGRVYGGTHVKVEDTNSTRNYGGGHFFAYDPKTDATEDLGWVRRHEGIITCTLDRGRNTLYGITWPTGYLVRCRIGEKEYQKRLNVLDLACSRVDCSPRYVAVVADGRVYACDGADGGIGVFDPKADRLYSDTGLLTPPGPALTDRPAGHLRESPRWRNWWITGTLSPDGRRIYLTSQRAGHLVEVDSSVGRFGRVIDHGRTVPWGEPSWGGPFCGIMAFAEDGLLYHTVGERLLSFDPSDGVVRDLGRTAVDGRPVALEAGGQLARDGRIYAVTRHNKQTGLAVLDPAKLESTGKNLRISPHFARK